jgi:hypothetical protein
MSARNSTESKIQSDGIRSGGALSQVIDPSPAGRAFISVAARRLAARSLYLSRSRHFTVIGNSN